MRAHDPAVHALPADLCDEVELCASPLHAAAEAEALVVCTPWPDYLSVSAQELLSVLALGQVIDPAGALRRRLDGRAGRALPTRGHAFAGPRAPAARVDAGTAPAAGVARRDTRVSGGALAGRTALITGGSQGLGLEIALMYLEEGAAGVCVCARDRRMLGGALERLRERASPRQTVVGEPADVSSAADVARLVDAALSALGEITILVSNAGVYGPKGGVGEARWPEWTRAVEINLFGSVLPARELTAHFVARGYGKVVQLSGGGATGPLPGLSAYAASKAAVVRFAETLAEELREHRVDVNAIAPGALNTRMLDEVLSAGPERVGHAFYARAVRAAPQRRDPAARGGQARRLPRLCGQRRHHRQAAERDLGPVGAAPEAARGARLGRLHPATDRAARQGHGLG